MRAMTEAKRSLLLALIADGATGIAINNAGVWRVAGGDPTGQAPPSYATTQTWTTATVMSLWSDDILVSNGSRGSMRISAAGRQRALELRRLEASSTATSSPGPCAACAEMDGWGCQEHQPPHPAVAPKTEAAP